MSKSTGKVKRHLIDDLNASISHDKCARCNESLGIKGIDRSKKKDVDERKISQPTKGGKIIKNARKVQIQRSKKTDNNNNAVPCDANKRISGKTANVRKDKQNKVDLVPIIQTRGMKSRSAGINQLQSVVIPNVASIRELRKLNAINTLSYDEILGGDQDLVDVDAMNDDNEVDHNGVELLIQGSDLDDDLDEGTGGEPGELPPSSDSEGETATERSVQKTSQPKVASKVIKVAPKTTKTDKFSHL